MKQTVKASNKFATVLAAGSSVDSVSETGYFTVAASTVGGYSLPPSGKKYFLVLDYGTSDEEIFRID